MIVRRINMNRPMTRLTSELDHWFGDFLGDCAPLHAVSSLARPTFPAIDLWEDGDALRAEVELPGLKVDDLEVLVVGDELTIKGERIVESEENARYHRHERCVGSFHRVLQLPVQVDTDRVEATLRDGVLTIVLPKAEATRTRKIEVKR